MDFFEAQQMRFSFALVPSVSALSSRRSSFVSLSLPLNLPARAYLMKSNRFLAFAHQPDKEDTPDAKQSKKATKPEAPTAAKRPLKAPTTPKSKRNKSNGVKSPKTQSFHPIWDGSLSLHFPNPSAPAEQHNDDTTVPIEPHTLILGTHPSIASLSATQYYGHPMNAFWWIVGDCLGFRRAEGTKTNGEPYKFTTHLRHTNILSYKEQVKRLIQSGFALWDLIGVCRRPGSLDQDITDETPNDIPAFCRDHPSIRRIVFANGSLASKLFAKHNKDWLRSGQLVHSLDETSKLAFGKLVGPTSNGRLSTTLARRNSKWTSDHQIVLVSAISVSPAAARYSYLDKRTFWEENVYQPGLELFQG